MLLLMGVMISVYVLHTDWQGAREGAPLLLKYVWVAVPYVALLLVLLVPVSPLNEALKAYKLKQQQLLRQQMAFRWQQLCAGEGTPDERQEWRLDYEFLLVRRQQLYAMRTLPFAITTNIKFVMILVGSLATTIKSALDVVDKLPL